MNILNAIDYSPMWISLKTAGLATVITFVFGIAISWWMTFYQKTGKGLIDGLLIMPMVLPPTVVGFILLLIFGKNGPIGKLLLQLGTTVIFSWPATVIAATVVAFPLMYKTTCAAFEQVNPDFMDAARTLGASEWKVFFRVVMPLAWPGVLAGTILTFARALGEFGATLMLAGSIPGKTQTIPVAIFFAVESGNMEQAMLWVFLITIISFTVLLALNYWSKSRNSYFVRSRGL
jgi:molybdate transport system permease protein